MEGVRSRSESPFARTKTKGHFSNTSESGGRVIENMKCKKKTHRNKNKQQLNGKDNEDLNSNGQDFYEEEKVTSNEIDNVVCNNIEHGNQISTENKFENGNGHEENQEGSDDKEIDVTTTVNEISKEVIIAQADGNLNESGITKEYDNTEESENAEEDIIVDEVTSDNCGNTTEFETESSAKKDTLVLHDPPPECEVLHENSEEKDSQDTNNKTAEMSDLNENQKPNEEHLKQEVHQIGFNGSDDSLNNQEAQITEDHKPASPDTVSKDDKSLSNKISNFLGKFAYSGEQKQDSEITSSKKLEKICFNHPYLSKVSGRRGIRDRLNSSATVFSSTEKEPRTPEHLGVSLDDSFRVHTNPSRLNSELNENPTLRKFKGKRCLNASDEPEEEENAYIGTMKRRKLDDRTNETGILGSILWSPFKKKPLENENQLKLTTTESKLSKLLSPFWFWKKATEGQKRK